MLLTLVIIWFYHHVEEVLLVTVNQTVYVCIHYLPVGFMTKEEKDMFESVKADVGIWWLPALWFSHYLQDAQNRGQIMLNDGARLIMTVIEFNNC